MWRGPMINNPFMAVTLVSQRMSNAGCNAMTELAAGDRTQRAMPCIVSCLVACLVACLAVLGPQPAFAGNCPGHPDALGTSRTLVVDPRAHPVIGTMQYRETLPLEDHEVVLTFDDGPIPKYSDQILDILAAQCIKATFFVIGRMAREYPDGVRKLIAAGHSVGTHSQNHPLSMNRMPLERAKQEIDDGIASVASALGDAAKPAPFFRIPGLLRAEAVEDYLTSQGIQTWSADFPADDWRHISSRKVHDLALSRIEAKGKGILLLHDIQARTVAALPQILSDLKAQGFRIVHVVPSTPDLPPTPTDPQQWQLHPVSEHVAISRWPKIPNFIYADTAKLPAPAISASDQAMSPPEWFDRAPRGPVPAPEAAPWPEQPLVAPAIRTAMLPVPAHELFQMTERLNSPITAMIPLRHRSEKMPPANGGGDDIARLISIDASAARRGIPGSMPVTQPGLQPVQK